MSERERTALLTKLSELSQACPEMRLGQLITNLAVVARGTEPSAVWDMEDEELRKAVDWQLAELQVRRSVVQS